MANDETRAAAERLAGNCWNSYLGDPPRDWQEIFEKLLADGRAVATELERLRAANAELVQLMKESLMFTQLGVYTFNASLVGGLYPQQINLELLERIRAALARHDAGKGGGE